MNNNINNNDDDDNKIFLPVHHIAYSLLWCGGLCVSIILRPLRARMQTPGTATHAGQVKQ